jgi:hypothetical protein
MEREMDFGTSRIIVTAVAVTLTAAGLIVWRRDKASFLLLLIGPVVGILGATSLGWDNPVHFGMCVIVSLGLSVAGYWVARSKPLSFSVAPSLVVGGATPMLTLWAFTVAGIRDQAGTWYVLMLPAGLVFGLAMSLIMHIGRVVLRDEASTIGKASYLPKDVIEERRIVLEMLSEGKVSPAEASQLLDAVGGRGVPADRLPLSSGTVGSLVGGIVVIIGWVMPWAYRYATVEGVVTRVGYEAGYHRTIGWLIVTLGFLPTLFACIPALDRHLRQGMLRLFLALIGAALAMSLLSLQSATALEITSGVVLCLVGFGIQVVSALKESGLFRAAKGEKR